MPAFGMVTVCVLRPPRTIPPPAVCGLGSVVEKQAVVIFRRGDRNPEAARIGQFAEGDFEVCFGTVGAVARFEFSSVGIAGRSSSPRERCCRLRLSDSRRCRACRRKRRGRCCRTRASREPCRCPVAFDEAILRAHEERLERERLLRRELRHQHVGGFKQSAARAQDELLR